MTHFCTITIFSLAIWVLSGVSALSQPKGLESLKLLSGWQKKNGDYVAALELRLEPGWKTYWRVPGEAGIAAEFSFIGSNNLKAHRLDWPAPILFGPKKLRSIGYKDSLILPIIVTPQDKTKEVNLSVSGRLGICDTVCVPLDFSLQNVLTPKTRKRDPKIIAALASMPRKLSYIENLRCKISKIGEDLQIEVSFTHPPIGQDERVVIEYDKPSHRVKNMASLRKGKTLSASAILQARAGSSMSVARSDVFFTLVSETKAFDLGTCAGS